MLYTIALLVSSYLSSLLDNLAPYWLVPRLEEGPLYAKKNCFIEVLSNMAGVRVSVLNMEQ